MNKFIYFRCSTEKQDNDRQLYTIKQYLNKIGENISEYQIFSDEGISGSTTIAERKTKEILKQLSKNDLILVVEMSRMSRNFADRVGFIAYCDKIGAKIYDISKQRYVTLNTSDGGIVDIIDSWQDDTFLRNLRRATRQGVLKAKARGKKFGRANENYNIDIEKQKEGRIKAAKTLNEKTIHSADFQSFCRILKRVFPQLQATPDLWGIKKDEVISNITSEKLIEIGRQMSNARADNPQLFNKFEFGFDSYHLNLIRSKIHNTFRSINKFNK